jgi:hypothetical protein
MRRFLWFSTAFILAGLLVAQADARSTGEFSGRAGSFGGTVIGVPRAHISRPIIPGRRVIGAQRFHAPNLRGMHQRFLTSFPIGGIWPGFWWPNTQVIQVPVEETAQPQPQPQIIVLHSDRAANPPDPPPDFGYVAGCHAIPNGYHCDASGR